MNARPRWFAPDLWFWAAVLAGVSYCLPAWSGWQGPAIIAWKGVGVGLLAVAAAMTALAARRQPPVSGSAAAPLKSSTHHLAFNDALLLTAVMACGALGDVLLDAISLVAGAAWFALAHLLAMGLYWRNRRHEEMTSPTGVLTRLWPFWLGVPLALGVTAVLARGQPLAGVAVGYTLLVALMAAFAWRSRFSRWLTGLGAFLFVVSDLCIFARTAGPVALQATFGLLVWPLYFGGQALIAKGVMQGPQPG
jgi:hypothetical protein